MGQIRGYVIDKETEDSIPDVAIYHIAPNGSYLGVIANADEDGDYEFELPAGGGMVEFDHPSYEPFRIDPRFITSSGRIELNLDRLNQMEGVVVVGKRTIRKPKYVLPVAMTVASGIALAFAITSK